MQQITPHAIAYWIPSRTSLFLHFIFLCLNKKQRSSFRTDNNAICTETCPTWWTIFQSDRKLTSHNHQQIIHSLTMAVGKKSSQVVSGSWLAQEPLLGPYWWTHPNYVCLLLLRLVDNQEGVWSKSHLPASCGADLMQSAAGTLMLVSLENTWSNLAWGSGQCEMFQWHICGNMLGMVVLSPSHTQDIGHQGCTRTAHGSPILPVFPLPCQLSASTEVQCDSHWTQIQCDTAAAQTDGVYLHHSRVSTHFLHNNMVYICSLFFEEKDLEWVSSWSSQ